MYLKLIYKSRKHLDKEKLKQKCVFIKYDGCIN